MEEEEVVYLKVFDREKGDVLFEGKVSTGVEPRELVKLTCFWERGFEGVYGKATNEEVKSFRGLQNNVELVAREIGGYKSFSGMIYVGADDGVLRKSEGVPVCECMIMSMWELEHEECEKVFKCETLEELSINWCKLRQIPHEIVKMKKLKKLTLFGVYDLQSIPEEIGEMSNLEELQIVFCGVESLPKRAMMQKSIRLDALSNLQLNAEDLVVFSKLKHLKIWNCGNVFTPPFTQSFWEMIKTTTDLRVLDLLWHEHNQEMVEEALEQNGSIVDGGSQWDVEPYVLFFKRNKENHERAMECVVHMLAIRRWRNALNGVPKEMVKMISMMLWVMRCDVGAWKRSPKE